MAGTVMGGGYDEFGMVQLIFVNAYDPKTVIDNFDFEVVAGWFDGISFMHRFRGEVVARTCKWIPDRELIVSDFARNVAGRVTREIQVPYYPRNVACRIYYSQSMRLLKYKGRGFKITPIMLDVDELILHAAALSLDSERRRVRAMSGIYDADCVNSNSLHSAECQISRKKRWGWTGLLCRKLASMTINNDSMKRKACDLEAVQVDNGDENDTTVKNYLSMYDVNTCEWMPASLMSLHKNECCRGCMHKVLVDDGKSDIKIIIKPKRNYIGQDCVRQSFQVLFTSALIVEYYRYVTCCKCRLSDRGMVMIDPTQQPLFLTVRLSRWDMRECVAPREQWNCGPRACDGDKCTLAACTPGCFDFNVEIDDTVVAWNRRYKLFAIGWHVTTSSGQYTATTIHNRRRPRRKWWLHDIGSNLADNMNTEAKQDNDREEKTNDTVKLNAHAYCVVYIMS
jgi:hypothetical protein